MKGFKLGFINKETNNAIEVECLLYGIQMAKENQWSPLIFEGDSQVVIKMATKLLHDTQSVKVVHLWRLEGQLEILKEILN